MRQLLWCSRCISANEVPNIKRGDLLTPAFSAYMGLPPHTTKVILHSNSLVAESPLRGLMCCECSGLDQEGSHIIPTSQFKSHTCVLVSSHTNGCWCLNGCSAGWFWSSTCEQAEAPPTVQDIGERFSEFARGFLQGLLVVSSLQD